MQCLQRRVDGFAHNRLTRIRRWGISVLMLVYSSLKGVAPVTNLKVSVCRFCCTVPRISLLLTAVARQKLGRTTSWGLIQAPPLLRRRQAVAASAFVFLSSFPGLGCAVSSSVTCVECQQTSAWQNGSGKSHRSIVDQSNLHHGLEYAILDFVCRIALLYFAVEVLVQPLGVFSAHGSVEVRLVALLR